MDNYKDFLINSTGKELMETLREDLHGFFSKAACHGGCSNHIFSSEADIEANCCNPVAGNYCFSF